MSQALYRKWRPQSWEAVVGQPHVIQTLRNALAAGRIAHAYLFAGPRGTGKTTTARLLAKAVNCLDENLAARPCGECEFCQAVNQGRFLDLIEIDAASNTSVDDVRDLREKINFSPNQGRYKVYIIDEVHMLSTAAFNALLKTLEEPPSHAIFVLATTEVHKIPATVLSRCQRHEFRRIPVVEIVAYLKQMATAEDIGVDDEALTLIARQSTGAMRDAISLLDQLASTGQEINLVLVQEVLGAAASQSVLDLVEALIGQDPARGLDCIHAALDSGSDPRQLARQTVDYLRDVLAVRMGSAGQIDATPDMRILMARHAQAFTPASLLRVIRSFNSAAVDARGTWQPALPLEMAFVDSLNPELTADQSSPSPSPAESSRPMKEGQSRRLQAPVPTSTEADREAVKEPGPTDQPPQIDLSAVWDQIVSLTHQQKPNSAALLKSCKSHSIRGSQVMIGFASDILKEKMEKDENLKPAEAAFSQVLKQAITIRCFVDMKQRSAIPPGVEEDGIVGTALRDLGGELVDIS